MTDQLRIEGVGPVARSRVIRVNPDTGAEGRPKLFDSAAGCVTCCIHRHEKRLHELVYDVHGLLYCAAHRPRP